MDNNVFVNVRGFIGDTLFASSAAEHLKKDYDKVYYGITCEEPCELLSLNPYIDGVHVSHGEATPVESENLRVFTCGEVDQSIPATIQFQTSCGIEKPTVGYSVYTNKYYDVIAHNNIATKKSMEQKKIIAYQRSWKERTFGFTKEEYARGINVHPTGYGGRRRNIDVILDALRNKYSLIAVGLPGDAPNGTYGIFSAPTYSMTASIIKYCDWMIGAEGGLTNLAAGVGTKTIITGDFIHQLYGENGYFKKIQDPKMGPKTYFPELGHVTLDPFLTDEEVANKIMEIIG
jgi:hypothetical protein